MRPINLVPAGVVLLALGGIAAAAQFAGPAAPAAPGPGHAAMAPQQVAVTSAARACPPVQGGGSGQVAFIAGSPAASSSRPGEGQAELAPLPLAGAQLRTLNPISQTQPGLLSMLTTPPAQSTSKKATTVLQGWSVTATGTMAQTMEAEETTGTGLASVRCGEPGSELWFVGPGQQGGAAQIQLDLMNVDSLSASVDVSIITDAGQVQADGDTGITVPPHQTVTEALSSLAGNASVVAIEVRTSIGRVAADVSESSSHGGTASWLPSTAPPSTQLVIPGVPPSGGTAGLYIVVPGSANARIKRRFHYPARPAPAVRHADDRPARRLRLLRPAHPPRRNGRARAHGERPRHRRGAGARQRPGRVHRGHRAHQRAGRGGRQHHGAGPRSSCPHPPPRPGSA